MRPVPSRAVLATAILCLTATAGSAATASAHDAPMPGTARHGLLVDEPWVMAHWAPFDERVLARELRIPFGQLEAFLYDDHHTIAQLARHRHIGFTRLVRRLSAWADDVPGATRTEIERRTRLVLVSGHLAQHVFHHVFHGLGLTPTVRTAAGVPRHVFDRRRDARWSYHRLIERGGGDADATEATLASMIGENQAQGVATKQTPASEGVRLTDRQQARRHCWFTRPAQELDESAPYDRGYTKHAAEHTSADVPTTRAEQRVEDRLIARGLTGRPKGCWGRPQRLRIDPGAPLSRHRLRVLGGVPRGFRGPVNDGMDHSDAGHMHHDE